MDRNRNSNKFNIFNARSMSGHGLLTNELRVLWDFLGHRGSGHVGKPGSQEFVVAFSLAWSPEEL